jgi:hypothetical protein
MLYLQNLTDQLIGTNNLDQLWNRAPDQDTFLEWVELGLEVDEVGDMRPETLGKILCSFEVGTIMITREELFNELRFAGDCEQTLCHLVSRCLAYLIRSRLDGSTVRGIQPYTRRPNVTKTT